MSFLNFDIDKSIVEVLPPDKRYENNVSFLKSLFVPLKWLHTLFFVSYYEGTNTPYVAGTYGYLDQVSYEGAVYSSLINSNTDLPTVTTSWLKINDNFIGAQERSKYNAGRLQFEYALNRTFETTFKQPPLVSDIYITNFNPNLNRFIVGRTELFCSTAGQTLSSGTVGDGTGSVTNYNFTVNIPNTTLAIYGANRLAGFINKYLPIGLTYTITYY